MSVYIEVGAGESLAKALRKFKRKCQSANVFKDLSRHRHFTKPSMARRLKAMGARRRLATEREKAKRQRPA